MKTKKNTIIVALIIIFIAGIFFVGKMYLDCFNFKNKIVLVKLGEKFFFAEVADNQIKATKGLSGRKNLCERCAMLFVLDKPGVKSFWMKNMKFDLDIIWIRGNKIVQISPNIPYGSGEQSTASSLSEVNRVIEINAGMSEKIGLKVGDEISIFPSL